MYPQVDHCRIYTKLLTIKSILGYYHGNFLKVYKSHNRSKEVPEIKIKNGKLINVGFKVGVEYAVIYEYKKITLIVSDKKDLGYNKGPLLLFD